MKIIREIKNIILSEKLDIDINLSDEIVTQQFQDKVDWWCISMYQKLSEKFIIQFQDRVHWGCISMYQKLSEKFIIQFQDRVHWGVY